MWKHLIDLIGKLAAVSRRVEKVEDSDKRNTDRIDKLNQRLDHLTDIVQRLASDQEHQRDMHAKDMEILRLRLEVALLRRERGLPPASEGHGEEEDSRE